MGMVYLQEIDDLEGLEEIYDELNKLLRAAPREKQGEAVSRQVCALEQMIK